MAVETPGTQAGREALAELLAHPSTALLALDFDGTLSPIVERPEDARAHPGAAPVLVRLARAVGQVALLTGRPADEVVRLGGLDVVPELRVFGHYGLQRWSGGRLQAPEVHPGVDGARLALAELVAAAPAGTALEDKGHSLAVHTRRASDPAGAAAGLRPAIDAVAASAGLEVVPGRYVLELRPPGTDKGSALREAVAAAGARAVLVAGDDLGDLPAVAALRALGGEGVRGLAVCVDSPECPPALREGADLVVDGPGGLVELLSELADALGV